MREKNSILKNVDWWLVGLYFALALMGWMSVYAAVYNPEHSSIFDMGERYGKQALWIGTSVILIFIILLIDMKFFTSFAYVIYGATLLLLVAVLVMGKEVAGSKSWIQVGSFALQPSEFAKFATNLALAKYLSSIQINLKDVKQVIRSGVIIFAPSVFIFLQNDTGSALVYFSFILVLYREGFSGNFLVFGFLLALLFILTLLVGKLTMLISVALIAVLLFLLMKKVRKNILSLLAILVLVGGFIFSIDYAFENILQEHQKTRIEVLLGMKTDYRGAGYNVHQSLIAIGSGGPTGKGFLQGTQTKYNFVPEQSTDFIFCTVGEEWGFLGTATVVILFLFLLIRIIIVAERQRSSFSRIYGYGVASILFFHFSINIAMTIGLAPVIGIPLPFFSYGGSSLWSFTVLLFIFIKMDSYRLELL
ncbi:rod shape-determining protein RodA [Lentimicrobium sp. S6]|uniref:rod shape-determining protein RodA n=3 Tax=unclassified Lentimicrobium TaxID=2677434 RepID=UPI001552D1E1|nr:rod shape-determining protein RodA [Lentimicrobium sp. S6]NPD44458.1 rod shape-determining protein RodA [Lentimicrobium sp. S6]